MARERSRSSARRLPSPVSGSVSVAPEVPRCWRAIARSRRSSTMTQAPKPIANSEGDRGRPELARGRGEFAVLPQRRQPRHGGEHLRRRRAGPNGSGRGSARAAARCVPWAAIMAGPPAVAKCDARGGPNRQCTGPAPRPSRPLRAAFWIRGRPRGPLVSRRFTTRTLPPESPMPDVTADVRIRPLDELDLNGIVRINEKITGAYEPDLWEQRVMFYTRRDPGASQVAEANGKVVASCWAIAAPAKVRARGAERLDRALRHRSRLPRTGSRASLVRRHLCALQGRGATSVRTLVDRNDAPVAGFLKAIGFGDSSLAALERKL